MKWPKIITAILFMAVFQLSGEQLLKVEWTQTGFLGGGWWGKEGEAEGFFWKDGDDSGAGGFHSGPLWGGNLVWPGLWNWSTVEDLPRSWDPVWTDNKRPGLSVDSREGKDWSLWLDAQPLFFWSLTNPGAFQLGLGASFPQDGEFRYSFRLWGTRNLEDLSEDWFNQPTPEGWSGFTEGTWGYISKFFSIMVLGAAEGGSRDEFLLSAAFWSRLKTNRDLGCDLAGRYRRGNISFSSSLWLGTADDPGLVLRYQGNSGLGGIEESELSLTVKAGWEWKTSKLSVSAKASAIAEMTDWRYFSETSVLFQWEGFTLGASGRIEPRPLPDAGFVCKSVGISLSKKATETEMSTRILWKQGEPTEMTFRVQGELRPVSIKAELGYTLGSKALPSWNLGGGWKF